MSNFNILTDSRAFDQLADALSVLDDNADEIKAFDAMYAEAVAEDRQRTVAKETEARIARRRSFWVRLASAIAHSHYRNAGVSAAVDGDDVVVESEAGFKFSSKSVMGLWDFPAAVEVIGGWEGKSRVRNSRFKQKRDGGYDMTRIAERVLDHAHRDLVRQKMAAGRASNKDVAEALSAKMRFKSYSSIVTASSSPDKPIHMSHKIETAMSAEKAERIIAFLKAEGLISSYCFES